MNEKERFEIFLEDINTILNDIIKSQSIMLNKIEKLHQSLEDMFETLSKRIMERSTSI